MRTLGDAFKLRLKNHLMVLQGSGRKRHKLCWALIRLAGPLLVAGCSSRPAGPVVQPDAAKNLGHIGLAYDRATVALGHPPASPADLKPFLKPLGNPEDILRSPRDGLPYVIRWGVNFRKLPISSMPPPVIAYETEGANGSRYVLTVMGIVPMSEGEFAKTTAAKRP
jgi:hypothetical protein